MTVWWNVKNLDLEGGGCLSSQYAAFMGRTVNTTITWMVENDCLVEVSYTECLQSLNDEEEDNLNNHCCCDYM